MFKNRKSTKQQTVFLLCLALMILGTLLRLVYVQMTPFDISSHDLGYFMGLDSEQIGAGHIGYIEYLYKHGGLPDFSPMKIWSFYNPPLYHGISAVFLNIFLSLGQSWDVAWESLQFLPCLFISLAVIGSYLCLRELKIGGSALLAATAIFSFHPTWNYLSLTMNNDPLSMAFTVWAVYFTIRWYQKPTVPFILGIALCIGLGMMTKLTVALIAPPVALIFLYRRLKDRQWKRMVPQFALFAVVCVPLGMFWSVRNLILYDMPLGYIQSLPSGSAQNISGLSLAQRFGLPALSDFVRLESYWSPSGATGTADHNLWSQTLRTALFDDNMVTFGAGLAPEVPGRMLMIIALLLAILTVYLTVSGLCKAGSADLFLRIMIGSALLIVAVNFVSFCVSYPFTCTIHFRYMASALPLFSAAVGLWWKRSTGTVAHVVKVSYLAAVILFSGLSALVYLTGLPTVG